LIYFRLKNKSILDHSDYLPKDYWPSSVFPKSDEKNFSEYGLRITKTVYYDYKVSCGIVVGWVLKAAVDRGLDPAGALCELPRLFGGK
jgi:hypothetical protein